MDTIEEKNITPEPIVEEPDDKENQVVKQVNHLPADLIDKIQKENEKIYKNIVESLNIVDSLDLKNKLNILPIAEGIQNGCIAMIDARKKLRENCQFAFTVLTYKPAIPSPESKPLWDAVDSGSTLLFQTALGVLNVNIEFFSHFIRIQDSIGHFLKLNEQNAILEESTKWLREDLEKFKVFKGTFDEEVGKLTSAAFKTIKDVISNMSGATSAQTAISNANPQYAAYTRALNELQVLQAQKAEILFSKRSSLAEQEAKLALAKVEVDFANGVIKDRHTGLEEASKNTNNLRYKYETTSDYRTEKKERSVGVLKGWWLLARFDRERESYYEKVWTGEKERLDNAIKQWKEQETELSAKLDTAQQKKAHWEPQLVKYTGEVENLKKELEDLMDSFDSKIRTKQDEVNELKNKYDSTAKEIQDLFKKTQVAEEHLIDFLQLTIQMPQRAGEASTIATGISEFIKLFYDLIERRASERSDNNVKSISKDSKSIDLEKPVLDACKEIGLEEIGFILKDQSFEFVSDLQVDKETFDEILAIVEEKLGPLKLNNKIKLRHLCFQAEKETKGKKEENHERQKISEEMNRKILAEEMPELQIFFYKTYKALQDGCKKLQLSSPQQTLSIKNQ